MFCAGRCSPSASPVEAASSQGRRVAQTGAKMLPEVAGGHACPAVSHRGRETILPPLLSSLNLDVTSSRNPSGTPSVMSFSHWLLEHPAFSSMAPATVVLHLGSSSSPDRHSSGTQHSAASPRHPVRGSREPCQELAQGFHGSQTLS